MSKDIQANKEFCERIMAVALADAEAMSYDAGMNGATSGVAIDIRQTVRDWACGLKGIVPPRLHKYYDKVLQDQDPEYAEFVRLSKKFNKK